ncbi:hypothetical protein U1Q18_030515 [Sarracenia purpurea var. burkii]
MEDLSEEVTLLSQVEESISGARNKNSKSNSYMVTPAKEVCKSYAEVAGTIGSLNALKASQAQGCQIAANSIGCGELPINLAEHSSVGIADDSLDKDKSDFLHLNGMTNSNGLSKADLHQYEVMSAGVPLVTSWFVRMLWLQLVYEVAFALVLLMACLVGWWSAVASDLLLV